MAVAFVRTCHNAQNKVSENPTTVGNSPAAGVALGDLLVVYIAMDPNVTVSSVTDPKSNTYTLAGAVTNGSGTSGVRTEIWASKITTALVSGDNLTVNWSAAVVAKAIVALEFSGADNVADVAAGTATGSSTTPSAGLTPTLADDLICGLVGREGPNLDAAGTDDSDNTGGDTWHQQNGQGTSGGAGASNISVGYTNPANNNSSISYKITTSAAAQTYNPVLGTSRLWAEVVVTFKATTAAAAADAPNTSALGPRPSLTSRIAAMIGLYWSPATDTASAPATTTVQAETDFVLKANPRLGPRGRTVNPNATDVVSAPVTSSALEQTDFVEAPNPRLGPRGRALSTPATDIASAPITASAREQTDFALKANPRLGPRGRTFNTDATDLGVAPSIIEGLAFVVSPNPRLGPRGSVVNSTGIEGPTPTVTTVQALTDFLLRPNPRLGPHGRVVNSAAMDPAVAAAIVEGITFLLTPSLRLGPRGRTFSTPATDTMSAPTTASGLEQTDFVEAPNPRLGPRGHALSTPATDIVSAPTTSFAGEQGDFVLRPRRSWTRSVAIAQTLFFAPAVDVPVAAVLEGGRDFVVRPRPVGRTFTGQLYFQGAVDLGGAVVVPNIPGRIAVADRAAGSVGILDLVAGAVSAADAWLGTVAAADIGAGSVSAGDRGAGSIQVDDELVR